MITSEKKALDSKIGALNKEITKIKKNSEEAFKKLDLLATELKYEKERISKFESESKTRRTLIKNKDQENEILRIKNEKLKKLIGRYKRNEPISESDANSVCSLTHSEYPQYEFDSCCCSICFDSFRQAYRNPTYGELEHYELATITKCCHVFHVGCIYRASKRSKRCPLCNVTYTNEDIKLLRVNV